MDRLSVALRVKLSLNGSNKRKVVYFISTGDTCRSPMAAGYFRKLLEDKKVKNVEVRAAGVLTVTGLKASQEARQIMEGEGIDLERHRSSQLSPEMIKRADLILGMTPYHVQIAQRICEDAKGKTYLLQEFARADLKNTQIQDPMGCTLEVFKKRFKEIRQACDRLIDSEFINGHASHPVPEPRVRKTKEEAAKPKKEKRVTVAAAPKKVKAKPAERKKARPKEVAAKVVSRSKVAVKSKKLARSKSAVARSKSVSRTASKRRI